MTLRTAAIFARRELRGGLRGGFRGFRIFLACLALGVAAIAGVGSVRSAIQAGLQDQGAVLLGGEAQAQFTYRFANDEERAWLESVSTGLSEVADFRSMAVVPREEGNDRALTQIKAVDDAYPLLGSVELSPEMPLAEALAGDGAVIAPILADPLAVIGCLIFAGLIVSVYAHTIYFSALKAHDANLVVPFTLLHPLMTVGLGAWLTGDRVGWPLLIGGGIAVTGVAILVIRPSTTFTRRLLVRSRL